MPVAQVISRAWGNPVVRQLTFDLTGRLLNEVGAPAAKHALKEGVPKAKACICKVCKTASRRYQEPGKTFVVTEHTSEKNGKHFVSVSRDFDEEFVQTWYQA